MITKLKLFLVAAVVIVSVPLLSSANNNETDNGKAHDKVTLCHNGHSITINRAGLDKHLELHNKEGAKLTCYEVTPLRPCGAPPCSGCN